MPPVNPDQLFPELRIMRFGLRIASPHGLPHQFYLGSTWRGILGWELKRLICPFDKSTACAACLIQDSCPYYILFEQKTDLPGIADAPRAYVLYSPYAQGPKSLHLEITLLGDCCRFMPAILQALVRAQERGLGKEKLQFKIEEVKEQTPFGENPLDQEQDPLAWIQGPFSLSHWLEPLSSQAPQLYRLKLPTPLRLRRQGKYLVDLDLGFMLLSLARRLEALNCVFEQGSPLGRDNWLQLQEHFQSLQDQNAGNGSLRQLSKDLSWDDFSRFSRRQKKKVPMGGLVGECSFSSALPGLTSWLKCAELVHVGKGAAMGLGRVEIV